METKDTSKLTIPTELPEPLLAVFEKKIVHLISSVYQEKQEVQHIARLADGLAEISQDALAIGNLAYAHCVTQKNKRFEDYLITFDWSERVKQILILWRDILFEEHKTFLKVSDGDASLEDFQKQKTASRDILFEASKDVDNYLELTKRATPDHGGIQATWNLQNNPWQSYEKQFQSFGEQAVGLKAQFEDFWKSSGNYVVISSLFLDTFHDYLKILNQVDADLAGIINRLKVDTSTEVKKILGELEEVDNQVSIQVKNDRFNNDLNNTLKELPDKRNIYVGIDGGKLLYRDLNIRKSTRDWLDSEVMSEVYELFQISENNHNRVSLAIENIRNLLQSEQIEKEVARRDILQVLQNLRKNLEKSGEAIFELKEHVKEQTQKTLGVSRIFNDDFLTFSFQNTINQYRRYQLEWWESLKKWVADKGFWIEEYRRAMREEEIMSLSEKIVRVVKDRTLQPENAHYTNIFMTKGFIGSSFWVGREQELTHIGKQIDNWKIGYRGSMLLTGKRFSGKSLLGHLVNERFFNSKGITLKPEQRIIVNGRPFSTTYDLGEALDFIVKYAEDKIMLWIDDLELWQDDKITLGQNLRKLNSVIDSHAGRIFFMVSTNDWVYKQMDQWFEMDKVFQTHMVLDKMSLAEVKEAVLLRHSATHIHLVDEKGNEFAPRNLDRLIARLYRISEGNVGEVLAHWAALMDRYSDDKVQPHTSETYLLPDFLNPDIAILLRLILTNRRMNEYRLRKYLGNAFRETYLPILQRALNLGLIKRNLNDWLVINPMVANEVGRLLEKQKYLG